jgi:hypothetical protein
MAQQPAMVIEEVTDPAELTRARAQDERHRCNQEWLEAHWDALLPGARGKVIAVAGRQAFIAATPAEAWAWVESTHPDDDGAIVRYVRPTTEPRIYVSRRSQASVR